MLEVGRVCVKVLGREAGKKCVVVEKANENFVIVDGELKRRKCNINHLEPLDLMLKIKKDASSDDIIDALGKAGLKAEKKKPKQKKEKKEAKEENTTSKKAKK